MRVLVTGGGSDIGFAIARRRLRQGDEVFVTASSEASLERMCSRYQSEGLAAKGLVLDLAAPERNAGALGAMLESGLQALVLNAWTRRPPQHRFHELPQAALEEDVTVNLMGNLWLLRRVLPAMVAARWGRIVLVSSVSTVTGAGRYGAYVLCKSALEGLMRNLAVDYGEFNVLSNTVRLGLFKTERTKKYWSRARYVERMGGVIPQGTLGEPDHVGAVFDPLLSEHQYINGAVLDVTGGLPMFRMEGVLRP
ncbi:3-oxoacyl-ACP reductase [Myxococcus stipitatus DSM 14675]|uniref:3-oxoacyl-ACP reductase n=1 Tax=Myxococcus stipitatus (strain DSM 14675 / JCM 12634 / Mx s8) TaxID=1278073 RepID=L7U2E3_MYXSD|nr:SDR family NAD(P)-dependent oxidoreductase [Myxococcus stipitatus]AGC42921.1 3-oxoacyl-ACP reductase [Myxococcus stipitatus DSM 14675]